MARGKYLSLEEARKRELLDRFCEEHPSTADERRFWALMDAMTRGSEEGEQTSDQEPDAC